jgi:hypothetical protein
MVCDRTIELHSNLGSTIEVWVVAGSKSAVTADSSIRVLGSHGNIGTDAVSAKNLRKKSATGFSSLGP